MSNTTNDRQAYQQTFDAALAMLNDQQRGAVESIDGPVMALAGPGTGKTQLLAVRIGYILQQTDTTAREVLSLTFTDAGAFAMRKRLRAFIGTEANKVTISTFHSFCSKVIAENSDYFGQYRELELVSDLEVVDIIRKIIDESPIDSPLRRLKGNPYMNVAKIKDLFGTMKREQWSFADLKDEVDKMANRAEGHEVCKRRTKSKIWPGHVFEKGEVRKDKIEQKVQKFDGLLAAAAQLDRYDEIMAESGRYDYNDLINWVLRAFEENEILLAEYQEQYQYILVDEYQDTNRSQNKLVETLASYWDRPNLFVVGDDDQSIYKFQGAEMANIKGFVRKFSPQVFVLKRNYRSNQSILDHATRLIEKNGNNRIAKEVGVTKELVASHPQKVNYPADQSAVTVHEYNNPVQEEAGVIAAIQDLHARGVPYCEIAVLYSKHALAEEIIRYMTQVGVPVNVKRRVNVLKDIDIIRLLNLLRFLNAEYQSMHSGQHLLFEILHYDFFGLCPSDIGRISVHCRHRYKDEQEDRPDDKEQKQPYWREVYMNKGVLAEIGVSEPDRIIEVAQILEDLIGAILNHTLQVYFEKVMTNTGLLHEMLNSGETSWRLQVVNTLFDLIKRETTKQPTLSISELLMMIDEMEEERISLDVMKVSSAEDAVHFMTAHGSKGLEFAHVFLIGCQETNWERRIGNNFNYSYPQRKYIDVDEKEKNQTAEVQEQRRLFFVAITRAADHCYLSYAARDKADKDKLPTTFIAEAGIESDDFQKMKVDASIVTHYQGELLRFAEAQPQLIDHDLIDRVLHNFKMSSTSLNKYLRCPTAFYFENILRVPSARTSYIGYGNAVHYALEVYNKKMDADGMQDPGLDYLLDHFLKGIDRYRSHFTTVELANIRQHGKDSITHYYEHYHGRWTAPRSVKAEYKVPITEHGGVPISGTIDKVEVYDDRVVVVDYKTGNPDNASSKLKPPKEEDAEDLGGDYWRQVMFYYLLLKGDGSITVKIDKGVMDYIDQNNKGRYRQAAFEMQPEHIQVVSDQLVQAYADIQAHKFEQGCKDPDCKWCTFVAQNSQEALQVGNTVDEDEDRQHFEL